MMEIILRTEKNFNSDDLELLRVIVAETRRNNYSRCNDKSCSVCNKKDEK